MNWYVVRHPETGGVGVVAECALPPHRAAGWLRVSGPIAEMSKDQVVLADYAGASDLDAPPAEPAQPTAAAKAPAPQAKEK